MKALITDFMKCLDSYLASTRGCGHTELVKNGVKETKQAVIIVATRPDRELYRDCLASIIGMEQFIASFYGVRLPITLDNHVLSLICESYNANVARIKALENEIQMMERA